MSHALQPTPSTIPQLVSAAAREFGDSPFIEDTTPDGTISISFQQFESLARQVAAALIARGINHGDRIAIWAPNVHEWIAAALGAQCVGAVLVTLNTRYKGTEAAFILRQSRARLLFSIAEFLGTDYPAQLDDESLPSLEGIVTFRQAAQRDSGKHTRWESFLTEGTNITASRLEERMHSVTADDVSDILFTSGTTGKPKGVMTCHEQNLKTFAFWGDNLGVRPGDRYLIVNPFFHSFGYKAGILACLLKGVTVLPHAVFDSLEILKRIASEQITILPGPPTLFQSLLTYPQLDQYDISSLRCTSTGAAAIPVEMIRQMRDKLGFETVVTAYGLTEACGLSTTCRPGDAAETVATTSGRAIDGLEVRCVDSNNRPVAVDEPGEIAIRGYSVMKGYFENEAATREAIDADGWLHTGDIGVLDAQGNLRITDRLKDMFITGGFNCYPAEIENILSNHPAIAMNAIIGVPDERMGEVAMAFVVLKNNQQLTAEELIKWCREQMANYKVPRRVNIVDSLPLNASGKVMKPELRHMINA
ncbi:fatty acid--CoA ligase family protein [Aestuariicella hydrocarbonica]|uniref:Fatty acid--CoA ligase family protein n=1 Tax=Pseudomaricurvus hydrocarbonicus TaxID=1470433 RepID=A0A9E5JV82_9GAMM|nr:FadD3 family acyl-CoA ligase [Aestuariicella hydrocarbonica]NHO66076.1 fatty acid--CoA ligase family protein [Aestuariicella hydrocarbonica]